MKMTEIPCAEMIENIKTLSKYRSPLCFKISKDYKTTILAQIFKDAAHSVQIYGDLISSLNSDPHFKDAFMKFVMSGRDAQCIMPPPGLSAPPADLEFMADLHRRYRFFLELRIASQDFTNRINDYFFERDKSDLIFKPYKNIFFAVSDESRIAITSDDSTLETINVCFNEPDAGKDLRGLIRHNLQLTQIIDPKPICSF